MVAIIYTNSHHNSFDPTFEGYFWSSTMLGETSQITYILERDIYS